MRVLINLEGFEQQQRALEVMASLLSRAGKLILAEGFVEGFEALTELRNEVGLAPLTPASINYYSRLAELHAGHRARLRARPTRSISAPTTT